MFSMFRTHAVLFGRSIVILESPGPPGQSGLDAHERPQPGPQCSETHPMVRLELNSLFVKILMRHWL